MERRIWTHDELVVAFNLYLKLPFGKMHSLNPQIKELAELIGRSSNSVAMRLCNFASLDPILQQRGIKGLPGGISVCKPIWEEFNANREQFIFKSEQLLAQFQGASMDAKYKFPDLQDLDGETREQIVKARVNQNVFRAIVLANYESKCAVTGIDIPDLLIASHIIPWAENKEHRLDPENGICLSTLYDSAFDKGLIAIDDDYRLLLSPELKDHSTRSYYQENFGSIEHKQLQMPTKYYPKIEFLDWHYNHIFRK